MKYSEICLATNNPGKLIEFRKLLGDGFTVLSLEDIGFFQDIPETQNTLEGNSLQKARYIFDTYNLNSIADDTGLEVEVLDGAPGVFSARYAGSPSDSNKNIQLLLKNLKREENRKARFRTVITFLSQDEEMQFEGVVEGKITLSPRGSEGFGYDPVFEPDGFQKTFAEMPLATKNQFSHRARAIEKLVGFLRF